MFLYAAHPLGQAVTHSRLADRRPFRSQECVEGATLAVLNSLSREVSLGMLFSEATPCKKNLLFRYHSRSKSILIGRISGAIDL